MSLTTKEEGVLKQVLDYLEGQFDKELDAFVEVYDYDDEFVDIQVTLDNEFENYKLDRAELSGDKSSKQIAMEIN
jgi:hypothetical protein